MTSYALTPAIILNLYRERMKKFVYILSLMLLGLLSSCSDSISPDVPTVPDGKTVDIIAGAEFPEMSFAGSRAMGDQLTVDELRNSLNINLLVFDASGVMLQFIPPEDISVAEVDAASQKVYFRVRGIYSSTLPRRLHFIVTSAPSLLDISGGEYITAMANETTVMPALMSEGDIDSYWGVTELPAITENSSVNIKLLRNFVKISVVSYEDTNTFKLLGYTVVNRPSRGMIAPYIHSEYRFADFMAADGSLLSYDDVIAQGYNGVNPAGSDATMTHTSQADVEASLAESESRMARGEDSPYYIYERSQSELSAVGSGVMVTYVIVKGEYNGKTAYYKLDLGHNVSGDFMFYDLLRNFNYQLVLESVEGPGAPTLHEAMAGAANNNVSASIVTRDLFSISYNNEKIEVSTTRVIFTEETISYKIQFRYTVPDGLGYSFKESDLLVYDMGKDNATHFDVTGLDYGSKSVDLTGEVIRSASLSKGNNGWYTLTITTNNIPADASRKEQTLRVYYRGGTVNLGRTITVMLRQPWHLTNVVTTAPKSTRKSEFSTTFTVPPGLVSSQFPLTLTFESDKQNIYAKQGTDLYVATGKSGFDNATTDNVIRYEWRLEWSDYDSENGKEYTVTFLTNTTSAEDKDYDTAEIDASSNKGANTGREANNEKEKFCIRIANKGMKCIEPYYVNISRTN